jgi:hypothetical protein
MFIPSVKHFKAIMEIKKKILASRSLYMLHLEVFQNAVHLDKSKHNAVSTSHVICLLFQPKRKKKLFVVMRTLWFS